MSRRTTPQTRPRARLRARLEALGAPHGLAVVCQLDHPANLPDAPSRCLAILGPAAGDAMWTAFRGSAEYGDGAPDPLDRWSRRVITAMGEALGAAAAFFPSDGPPYPPFVAWALQSGQVHISPVGLLVHPSAGLWVSFRGALLLDGSMGPPPPAPSPCTTCPAPCLSACPAGALDADGYDVDGCHAYLDRPEGHTCMTRGCAVRRACPVGQGHAQPEAQSAFHMRAFHPL